jgi:hypothetical protein
MTTKNQINAIPGQNLNFPIEKCKYTMTLGAPQNIA